MSPSTSTPDFSYTETYQLGSSGLNPDQSTTFKKLSSDHISTFSAGNLEFLKIEPEAIRLLTAQAMYDIAHLLRPGHLQQLRNIIDDPTASANDHFVATELLKNANIAAGGVFPGCQDTGTAIIKGKKGQLVFTGYDEKKNHYPGRL